MYHRLSGPLWLLVSTGSMVLVSSWVMLRFLTSTGQDRGSHDAIIANSETMVTQGRQIFRSDTADGPFVLQNQATIRSKSEEDEPTSYQYRDNAAASGKAYWYYIGIVYKDGHKQQLTGPQKVVAK